MDVFATVVKHLDICLAEQISDAFCSSVFGAAASGLAMKEAKVQRERIYFEDMLTPA
jgi:hypothetical protein